MVIHLDELQIDNTGWELIDRLPSSLFSYSSTIQHAKWVSAKYWSDKPVTAEQSSHNDEGAEHVAGDTEPLSYTAQILNGTSIWSGQLKHISALYWSALSHFIPHISMYACWTHIHVLHWSEQLVHVVAHVTDITVNSHGMKRACLLPGYQTFNWITYLCYPLFHISWHWGS